MHLKKFILTALAFIIFNSFAYGQQYVGDYNTFKKYVREGYSGQPFFNIIVTDNFNANDDLTTDSEQSVSGTINGDNKTLNMKHLYNDRFYRGFILSGGKTLSIYNYSINNALLITEKSSGAAIKIDSSTVNLANVNFEGNRADNKYEDSSINVSRTAYGGSIAASNYSTINATGTIVFAKSYANANTKRYAVHFEAKGGAVYLDNSNMNFSNADVTFSENYVNTGGNGYYYESDSYRRETLGGAIYANNSSIDFLYSSSVSFANNCAVGGSGSDQWKSGKSFYGGAIYLLNSSFNSENTELRASENYVAAPYSHNARGGFLYADSSSVTFGSTTINVNYVTNSSGGSKQGGAIYFNGGDLTFNKYTMFFWNEARSGEGGAIYLNNSSNVNFYGNNTIFDGNSASTGGAFYVNASTVSFSSGSVLFTNNRADNSGGVFYIKGSSLSFTGENVEFSSNTANSGVVLYGQSSIVIFGAGNTCFYGNVSSAGNGIIEIGGGLILDFDNTNIRAYGNKANSGGFLYLSGNSLNFDKDVTMKSNETNFSDGYGGAMYLSDNSAVTFNGISNIFESNKAINGSGRGGAFYISGSSLSFTNTNGSVKFTSNTVNAEGGAIYLTGNSKLSFTVAETEFNYNEADSGGAFYLTGNNNSSLTFDTALTAIGNKAINMHGGFMYADGGQDLIFNGSVNFTSNTAATNANGGVIYLAGNRDILFTGVGATSEFKYNEAGSGGVFYLNNVSGSSLTFDTALTAIGNKAINTYGGFIYAEAGQDLAFNGSVNFTSNTANSDGGIIYLLGNRNISFRGTKSNFNYNKARSGGAFYLTGNNNSSLTFDSALTAIGNISTSSGGFIYTGSGQGLTFNGSVNFTGNTAVTDGGVIYLTGDRNILFTGTGSTAEFNYNNARSGGAFYLTGTNNSSLTFNNPLTAIGNRALNANGGFIYVDSGQDLAFKASVNFTNNTAVTDGGVIYSTGSSNISFAGVGATSEFNYNNAGSGGVFYLRGTSGDSSLTFDTAISATNNIARSKNGGFLNIYLSSASFQKNTDIRNSYAFGGGGAIYASSSVLMFSGDKTEFTNNISSATGGALAILNSALVNFNGLLTSFTENSSKESGSGGAIAIDKSTANFINKEGTVFSKNESALAGGAIYLSNKANLNFSENSVGSQFLGNKASSNGGAVAVTGGSTAKFYNAIFKENQSGGYGGAVSIEGINESNTSSMSFISKNVSGSSMTLFLGNTASSASNAVYLGNFSNTYFIAGSSSSIEMYDGMFGGEGDYINMFFGGEGNFNLYADALISSANITLSGSNGGTFNLYKGANLTAKRLVNEEGSIIKMNSDGKNTINLSEFENNGELEMTAAFNNNENDQILVSGDVTLSSTTSILKIALKNTRFDEKEFNLIYYGNNLSGEFGEIIYDDRVELGTATINYGSGNNDWISILLRGKGKKTRFSFIDGLSRNQYATAVTYDALSLISEENTDLDDIITAIDSLNNDAEIKEALNQASGYFLANVIRSAALGGDSNEVYNRIHDASQYDFAGSGLWAQAKANSANNKKDETSPGDYNDKIIGMMIGYDRYFAENALMFGFYGKYDMHDIKQEPGNEADIKSFGLGFYGGYIKDKWELKGLLSGNFDSYSTSREITFLPTEDRVAEADFTSTTMGFDLEGAYKVGINDDIDFRPYAGFEIRSVNYDQIKENGAQSLNLTVGSGNYARMSARLGAGINRKHNVYGWYINGEYKQLLNGELPEINNNFEGCDYKFTIVGSEEGKGALGVKAGGSYSVLENLMLYANLSYFVAERYDNIYGGFGVRFMMFGAKDGKRKQIERKDDLVAKRSALKQARRQSKIEIAEDNLKYEEDKLLQLQTSLVDKRRIEKDMQEEAKVAVREAQHAEDIFYSLYEPTSEELAQEEKIVKEKLRQEKDAVKAFSDAEKDSRKIEKYIEKQIKKVEKAKATLAKFQSQEEKVVESEKDLEREAERELKRLAKEEEKIKKEELKLKKTQEKKAAAEEKKIQKQIAAEEAAISDLDKEEAKLAKERAAKEKAAKKELERAEKQLLKEEKLIEKERKRIQKEEARLIAEQEKMLEYEAREKEREIESEKKKPKTAEPVKVEKTKEQLKIEAEIAAYEARLAAEKEKSVQKTTKEAAAEKKKAEEERKRKEQENLKKEKEEAKKQAAKLKEAALDKRAKEAASRRFQKVQKAFNLKFTPDNYKLVETAKITIREQAEEIKKLDYEKIIIEGHTDSEEGGSYEGRKKLSRMRSEEVCNEFIANGIPKEKIDFAGLADKVSIGDNKTDLGKIDNRRVEIVVE